MCVLCALCVTDLPRSRVPLSWIGRARDARAPALLFPLLSQPSAGSEHLKTFFFCSLAEHVIPARATLLRFPRRPFTLTRALRPLGHPSRHCEATGPRTLHYEIWISATVKLPSQRRCLHGAQGAEQGVYGAGCRVRAWCDWVGICVHGHAGRTGCEWGAIWGAR